MNTYGKNHMSSFRKLVFCWFTVAALLLSACGQKGPLTLQRDAPAETQAEEQATEDDGADDNGEQ
jgi:predicted small lipoprotein YifL